MAKSSGLLFEEILLASTRKTGRALWLALFGVLMLLLLALGSFTTLRLSKIFADIRANEEIAEPRLAAARQMEIDVFGYIMSVRAYLSGFAEGRQLAAEKAANLTRDVAIYKKLAETTKQREMTERFDTLWQELHAHCEPMLAYGRASTAELAHLGTLSLAIERLLEDEIQFDARAFDYARTGDLLAHLEQTNRIALLRFSGGLAIVLVTSAVVVWIVLSSLALLRESEERYRIVADFNNDWEFWIALDGHFAYVSPSVARITGREVPPGMTAEDFLRLVTHPEDLDRPALEHRREELDQRRPSTLEYRIVHSNGSVRWMHHVCQPVYDREGNFLGTRGSNRDITDRKQAEEDLRQSREDLDRAQAVGHTGSWRLDTRRDLLTASIEYYRIFGVPQGKALNRESHLGAVHPEERESVKAQWNAALRGEAYEVEHRIVVDGTEKWVHEKAYLDFGRGGKLLGAFGVTQDITARKEAQIRLEASLRELREAQSELIRQERLATLGRLAGSVAHEIRTPLCVMQNSIFFLERSLPPENEEVREVLAEMKRAIGNSDHIITGMLNFVLDKAPRDKVFRVGEVTARALKMVPLPDNIHLQRATREMEDIEVRADEDQVVQILANLIENAVHAMTDGGKLEIGAGREEGGRVWVTIRDTGCGIPEENLGKIFDPLFSTKVRGIGLGLAVAQRYARLNGGYLSVESEAGCGTTFRLELNSAT